MAMANPTPKPGSTYSEQLIASCQGLVRNLAWKIHQKIAGRVDLEDLISYGQVGLAEAASRFDPSRGGRFTTYAYYRIRGAILDGLTQMTWFNRMDYHASRYEHMAHTLLEDGDHKDHDSLEGDAHWLTDVSSKLTMVYLASTLGTDDRSLFSDLPDLAIAGPDAQAMHCEMRFLLKQLIEELPQRARSLIHWTYFDGLTLKEAGERLGISKSWASRLHEKTLRQLAKGFRRAAISRGQNAQPMSVNG